MVGPKSTYLRYTAIANIKYLPTYQHCATFPTTWWKKKQKAISLRSQVGSKQPTKPFDHFANTPWFLSQRKFSSVPIVLPWSVQNFIEIRGNLPLSLDQKRFFHTTASMAESVCRQNFDPQVEKRINQQINMELNASYTYLSMSFYFNRDDVEFPGVHKFFAKQSEEEREHAKKFMKYQNNRGGRIELEDIKKPDKNEWGSPIQAFEAALNLEKKVNQALLELHAFASGKGDCHLCDFLESHYLDEQVESIRELAGYITQLKHCGEGLGEFLFDKELGEEDS